MNVVGFFYCFICYFTLSLGYLNSSVKNIGINCSPNICTKIPIGSFILMQIEIIAITPTEFSHRA